MKSKQEREFAKARYQAYRERARELYASATVSITTHASVQMVEDGAFVDAVVWVPKEEINLPTVVDPEEKR